MTFYEIARAIIRTSLKIKSYKVEGLEHFPARGPVIVAANHVSFWDPVLVGCALQRQIYFMAKEELFKIPIFGKLLTKLGAFPVKRGQGDIAAIRKSLAILKEGKVLGIFPEGTRSKSGEIQEAMSGIVLIMEKSKAPIVPVKVYGTKGLLSQKRGEVGVIIGQPIFAEKLKVPEDVENRRGWLANEIMNVVSQM